MARRVRACFEAWLIRQVINDREMTAAARTDNVGCVQSAMMVTTHLLQAMDVHAESNMST